MEMEIEVMTSTALTAVLLVLLEVDEPRRCLGCDAIDNLSKIISPFLGNFAARYVQILAK